MKAEFIVQRTKGELAKEAWMSHENLLHVQKGERGMSSWKMRNLFKFYQSKIPELDKAMYSLTKKIREKDLKRDARIPKKKRKPKEENVLSKYL